MHDRAGGSSALLLGGSDEVGDGGKPRVELSLAPSDRQPSPVGARRYAGLDGLRGLAALYVVVFHCWLLTFRGFPANHGPRWLTWLMFGHLAVVFFLVLSGFSLALAPAADGWRLRGIRRFARRRAWRILPAYWAALAFSMAVSVFVVPQSHAKAPTVGSGVVYGFLLQDVLVAPTPNGAFWSIAVEVELYLLLPLLLVMCRRWGAVSMLAVVTLAVVGAGLLVPHWSALSPVDKVRGIAPQLLPVFAVGVAAAGMASARRVITRVPWLVLALLASAPVAVLIAVRGTRWSVAHYFWVDLAVGPAMALLLLAVVAERPAWLRGLLETAVVRRLGRISYSLYLVHLPVVTVVSRRLVGRHLHGIVAFGATVVIAVPVAVVAAWLLATVLELPCQRYRSWRALAGALAYRVRGDSRGTSRAG